MSVAIALPPLNLWAEQHVKALITAKTQADFDAAFDDFIADKVEVTFNGARLTRDEYKKKFQNERILEESATVTVDDTSVIVTPLPGQDTTSDSGNVGLFFNATYFEIIKVFGASDSHKLTSILIIKVEPVGPAPVQPPHTVGGGTDRRRAVEVNEVSLDTRVPIKPPTGIPPQK